jgi:hypothetical protein
MSGTLCSLQKGSPLPVMLRAPVSDREAVEPFVMAAE